MKFFAVAAITMAALVSAQSAGDVPSCALPCLEDSVKKTTSCDKTDFKCICKEQNFSKVQGDATSCVLAKCGSDVALNKVLPATQKLCASASEGGSSEAASSASASTETASEVAEAHPTHTAEPTESEVAGNTECPATVATVATVATQPCPSTLSTPSSPPNPATNDTAPPAPSTPVTAGAAGLAPIGGLAMLAIGALAL
ncbi:hypothetical protein J3459_011277 [Metarhizium acridum]|uniref:CFEM domain-containing protein n=1 Tax=Metarhizium acridum (strain CQMa 102) TaxID=655827 RepID=E9E6T2_METAQ|nr:uncharacterized protein MAC_05580 [Metarhizium acridum CQMa 102]EFY88371.1 hypothetical protein MAC_05580 [Metarhizium acridum CQMa 102]KAG8405151.1 hypothetical protein J3458_021832 [Metarhizium acridum]KAG8420229.1 hypothetical protein J3459_011277 [Metarhizium acridum]